MRTTVEEATESVVTTELDKPLVGHVVEILEHGEIRVRVPVFGVEFLTAVCAEHVAGRSGGLASLIGKPVIVMCLGGNSTQAVICGVLGSTTHEPPVEIAEAQLPRPTTALLDGERVVLKASAEIVLECGRSSLTLTGDGRIVMKGVELVSRALRTNKIKGATVNIN